MPKYNNHVQQRASEASPPASNIIIILLWNSGVGESQCAPLSVCNPVLGSDYYVFASVYMYM